MAANRIHATEFALVHELGMYDWFPSLTPESEALDAFCLLESELCENFLSEIMDPVINNIPRYEMGAAAFPAGQSY